MQAVSLITMNMSLLNMNIMANLKTDPIPVVIARFNIADGKSLAILQKDVPSIVAIEVGVVLEIPVKAEILYQNIGAIFTGQ